MEQAKSKKLYASRAACTRAYRVRLRIKELEREIARAKLEESAVSRTLDNWTVSIEQNKEHFEALTGMVEAVCFEAVKDTAARIKRDLTYRQNCVRDLERKRPDLDRALNDELLEPRLLGTAV
jgi:hypothetical protein